jgi:hypothetical protein
MYLGMHLVPLVADRNCHRISASRYEKENPLPFCVPRKSQEPKLRFGGAISLPQISSLIPSACIARHNSTHARSPVPLHVQRSLGLGLILILIRGPAARAVPKYRGERIRSRQGDGRGYDADDVVQDLCVRRREL